MMWSWATNGPYAMKTGGQPVVLTDTRHPVVWTSICADQTADRPTDLPSRCFVRLAAQGSRPWVGSYEKDEGSRGQTGRDRARPGRIAVQLAMARRRQPRAARHAVRVDHLS
jgi:hypothetical protein